MPCASPPNNVMPWKAYLRALRHQVTKFFGRDRGEVGIFCFGEKMEKLQVTSWGMTIPDLDGSFLMVIRTNPTEVYEKMCSYGVPAASSKLGVFDVDQKRWEALGPGGRSPWNGPLATPGIHIPDDMHPRLHLHSLVGT